MICGNAALLYESPDESSGRSLKFSRSMMGRFRRDSSLDRATRLKEARDRRSRYLADLEKRDQDRERGRDRYPGEDHSGNYNERSEIALLEDSVGSLTVSNQQRQHRKLYNEPFRAAAAAAAADCGTSNTRVIHPVGPTSGSPSRGGSQSSPTFHRPITRSPRPRRPSTTPARAISPPRLGESGPPRTENRQSATERAARIYRAGASSVGDPRRSPSPARGGVNGSVFKPQPPWNNRILPKSPADRSPRRLSPREHGRQPALWPPDESCTVGRGQTIPEVPRNGDMGGGNTDGIIDCRRRPLRPATTGGGPSRRFSRPMSAFSGRWDKDESFPDKPPANLSSESRESRHVLSGKGHSSRPGETAMAVASQEHEPLSPSKGRDCSAPPGACSRARSAEEMPAIQRARHLELQRLAIEKKELEAQLAEVKKLMRARKVRPNAALIGLLDAAAGAAPKRHRGERLTRRRRERRRRKPRRSLAESSPEYSGVARRAIAESSQGPLRRQEDNETFDTSTEYRVVANRARNSSSPARAAGGGWRHTPRRRRRRRKSSGERGRETRRRPHKAHVTRTGSHGTNSERRRTPEHAGKRAVAFNTTVPAERPATAGVVRAHYSPRGRESGSGREGSPTRKAKRPKSASRQSRSAPSPSMYRTNGLPTPCNSEYTEKGPGDARQVGRRKGGGGKTSTRVDSYDSGPGRSGDIRDDEKRRVYFSKFPIGGNSLPAAMNSGVERKGGGQSVSMSPPRATNSRERLIEREKSRSSSCASYLGDRSDEDAVIKKSVSYYEDDFEVVSARGSYESDFEPWENSKSDFELLEQSASVEGFVAAPEEKQVLALEGSERRPRADAITGTENQQEVRDRRSHPDSDDDSGGECSDALNDDLLRGGENWGDGRHVPAASTRVDSGGAASWKEWNQPDDGPALSDEWATTSRKPAATHHGSVEGSAEFAAGFDYLWVEDHDDVLLRGTEEKAGGTGSSYPSRDTNDKRPDRAHVRAPGEERFSVLTSGGKSPLPHSERIDEVRSVKPINHQNNREDERVSTASLSDGGASLYDILVSSPDRSDSDETWSLESYDRRDGEVAAPSVALSRAGASAEARPLQDAKLSSDRRVQDDSPANAGNLLPAARESSDGSSLYDMTSPASDVDDDMTLGRGDALQPRLVGKETAEQAATSRHPLDAAGKIDSTQEEISHGSRRDAQASPSDVKVETVARETTRIETVEKMLPESNASLFGQLSVGVRPTSFGEVGDEKPARKGRLPQRPFAGDVDAVGGVRGSNAIVDGHELEYNGSYDEYSPDGGSGSLADGVAAYGKEDARNKIADKRHIDEPTTGDRSSHGSAASAGQGHQLNDRNEDGVKPARGQGATTERGHGPTLESEESLDHFFALGENGETYRNCRPSEGGGSVVDVNRMSERRGEPSAYMDRERGAARFEEGQNHVVDGSQLEAEGSLDELSSLEKQGESRAEQSDGDLLTQAKESYVVRSRIRGGSSAGVEGEGTVNRSQLVIPEESLDERSSLSKQREAYKDANLSTSAPSGPGQGPSADDDEAFAEEVGRSVGWNRARVASNVEEGRRRGREAEGSLKELSSFEKNGDSNTEQSTTQVPAHAENPPIVEDANGGARNAEIGVGSPGNGSQLAPEESLDELSSLDKQGEPYEDGNQSTRRLQSKGGRSSVDADGVFAGGKGLHDGKRRHQGAPSVEESQSRVVDGSQLEAEGSLDELSSLEKQGEPRGDEPLGVAFPQQEVPSVDESINHGMRSDAVGEEGIAKSGHLEPEESLDKLSSLGKQGEPYKDEHVGTPKLSSEEGRPSDNSGSILAGAEGVPETTASVVRKTEGGHGRVASGSHLEAEGSLDELSSLEKQGEFRIQYSTEEVSAQAKEASIVENGNRSIGSAGVGEGGIADSSQQALEESLDQLSSLDKQGDTHNEKSVIRLYVEGQESSIDTGRLSQRGETPPLDEEPKGNGISVVQRQNRIVDSLQLDAEGSLDELSSLEKQGGSRAEYSAGEVFEYAGEPSTDESTNRGTRSPGVGGGGTVNDIQVAPEESLDELSSLGKQGQPSEDDQHKRLSSKEQRSYLDSDGWSARGGQPSAENNGDQDAPSVEGGQSRIADGVWLEVEESLDELSSLERQEENRQERSADERYARAEEPFADENGHRGTRMSGLGEGGTFVHRSQVATEESLDGLSSQEKRGDLRRDRPHDRGSAAGGESSIDEYYGTTDNIEAGQGRGSKFTAETSVDELSSVNTNGKTPRQSGLVATEKTLLRGQPEQSDHLLDNGSGNRLLRSSDPPSEVSTVHGQPDSHQAKQPISGNSSRGDLSLSPSEQPVADENGSSAKHVGRESLDEYLFDSEGASSFADLPSLGESSSGGGRSRGHKATVSGNGSSSSEKHSLDQSLGGLSSADDGNSQLFDAMSLTGRSVTSTRSSSFGGSLSEDVLV